MIEGARTPVRPSPDLVRHTEGGTTVGIGTGIFLIVVGAILAFGIEPDAWSVVNLNVVGYILMVGGLIALILGLVVTQQRQRSHHVVERYDDRYPPPAV